MGFRDQLASLSLKPPLIAHAERPTEQFHVLTIVNSAAVNIGVHVSFQIRVFIFSGYHLACLKVHPGCSM